jgi:uncharacterized oxidoreductase
MPTFTPNQLRGIGAKILEAVGTPKELAERVADSLVKSNLMGIDSHGILRVVEYSEYVERGEIVPWARPTIVRETLSTALMDGHWGFGQVAAEFAMKLCIEKCKDTSISTVGIFNCNHIGNLGEYALMAAEQGMIGIVMCSSGPPGGLVVPYGGKARRLATNPLSVAAPTGTKNPFLMDFSTSMVSEGKVRVKYYNREKIPLGWIVDENGRPTDNPADLYYIKNDVVSGESYRGAILPSGGHKGYALSLLIDIFGGILTTSGCAFNEGYKKFQNGVFMITVGIDSFVSLKEFKERIDAQFSNVKSSPPAVGYNEVLLPGELEFRTKERKVKEGIQIPEKVWQDIIRIAKKAGIYKNLEKIVSKAD